MDPSDSKKNLCEAKGISKDFTLPHGQLLHALQNINLSIYPNEVVAITGPSGCGKSTLLRILAGLESSTQGEVFYHEEKADDFPNNVSIVFQAFALYPWMTVKGNIEMALKTTDLSTEEIQKKV